MQVEWRKIHNNKNPFSLQSEGAVFYGEFWRSGKHSVALDGVIEGTIVLTCDRCGESFEQPIAETVKLEVVDRPLKVNESLDVVECFDGSVDFDAICESELASYRSEYHLCPRCKEEDDFEIIL
jgi:hypothetical protein